jgi:non-homologous end joining protein Ku
VPIGRASHGFRLLLVR